MPPLICADTLDSNLNWSRWQARRWASSTVPAIVSLGERAAAAPVFNKAAPVFNKATPVFNKAPFPTKKT